MSDLLGTIRKFMGMQQEDMDEYYEEDAHYAEDDYYPRRQASMQYEDKLRGGYAINERGKVVDMPTDLNDMKVAVKKPAKYDDARIVCDKLKAFAPVVVNLEKLDRDEAQRVVDFIMGACYTMDGHVEEIKEDVFLVAPSMVNIEKEFDEDRNNKSRSLFGKFSF